MTTHDQHTDAYADQAAHGQPQYAADNQNYVPEDQVAPMQHDTEHNTAGHETDADGRLFADDELAGLRARWDAVQAGFVDDPKDCVQKADGLVADLVQQLTTGFGQARSRLEEQWGRGEQASTEDLRVALKRYRSFFERLLSV